MLLFEPKRIDVLYPSTAAAATNPTITPTKKNFGYKGVRLAINVSAFTGTSITFTINALDPISGNVSSAMLASAAITGTGTSSLLIYPGATAVTNKIANDVLPRDWNVTSAGTHTVATFSVSAEYIS